MAPERVTSKSNASRTRVASTRRARYGTVARPTKVASKRATEARITVASTFPESRDAVEKIAAAKANARPKAAAKKRSQAPELPWLTQRKSPRIFRTERELAEMAGKLLRA